MNKRYALSLAAVLGLALMPAHAQHNTQTVPMGGYALSLEKGKITFVDARLGPYGLQSADDFFDKRNEKFMRSLAALETTPPQAHEKKISGIEIISHSYKDEGSNKFGYYVFTANPVGRNLIAYLSATERATSEDKRLAQWQAHEDQFIAFVRSAKTDGNALTRNHFYIGPVAFPMPSDRALNARFVYDFSVGSSLQLDLRPAPEKRATLMDWMRSDMEKDQEIKGGKITLNQKRDLNGMAGHQAVVHSETLGPNGETVLRKRFYWRGYDGNQEIDLYYSVNWRGENSALAQERADQMWQNILAGFRRIP